MALSLLVPAWLNAATLVVDKVAGPYTTIQSALNAALAGDTVQVRAGTYKERVIFQTGGTSAATPVTLAGDPGAVIDGSNTVTLNWISAPEIGLGVYKATVSGFAPRIVTANGLWVTPLDKSRFDDNPTSEPRWQDILSTGIPGGDGMDGLRAVSMYDSATSTFYIHFDGYLNPAGMAITLAPNPSDCVSVNGKNYCVVKGLALRNAINGVSVVNSVGTVVENCDIGPTDVGVSLGSGSDRCIVRNNNVHMDPYFGADPWREEAWDSWLANKSYGYYNRYGIYTANAQGSKGGHEIYDNYIHDHWDGISTGASLGTTAKVAGDKIHHNLITVTFDNAIKLSYNQDNNEVSDNIIDVGRVGIRISNPPVPGPLFVYRNLIMRTKSSNLRLQTGSGGAMPDCEVWVYHNTGMADTSVGVEFDSAPNSHTPHYYFKNNLWWCITTERSSSYAAVDWQGDYNAFVKAEPGDRPFNAEGDGWSASTRLTQWNNGISQANSAGIEQHSLWQAGGLPGFTNSPALDLSLTSSSVAKDRGENLSTGQPRSLPGCPVGYFVGSAPDCGALEVGQQMPVLPRTWLRADVGPVAAPGTFSLSGATFTIEGSGADIAHTQTADEFCYVYQPASGDCEIVARVVSVEVTHDWAKAGVMIRESLATGAKHALMSFSPVSTKGYAFIRRLNTNGTAATNSGAGYSLPYWVKIKRTGNTFQAYRSWNGTNWSSVGSAQTISMASDVLIGMAVTSRLDGTLSTAVLDSVVVTP